MGTRGPSKKWRVMWQGGNSRDHRSQPAAYEQVRSLNERKIRVTVFHWRDGGWQLWERCNPIGKD